MRHIAVRLLSLALLAASPAPAFAGAGDDHLAAMPLKVSQSEARSIAWRYGIVRIEEIGLYDDHWQIAGRDSDGGDLIIDIDARSGEVTR